MIISGMVRNRAGTARVPFLIKQIRHNVKNKSSMKRELKNILIAHGVYGEENLNEAVERILLLLDVVGRSEQLLCPNCKSQYVYEFTCTDGFGCNSCGNQWAK